MIIAVNFQASSWRNKSSKQAQSYSTGCPRKDATLTHSMYDIIAVFKLASNQTL